ncbi:MAG: hypothetical protein LBS72_02125 [Oscillospiraceae bacterium]|nr:hypothetical protein [Oscillospiraceae bacterium]
MRTENLKRIRIRRNNRDARFRQRIPRIHTSRQHDAIDTVWFARTYDQMIPQYAVACAAPGIATPLQSERLRVERVYPAKFIGRHI